MDCHEQWEPRGTIKIIQLSVTIINDELDVCGEWSKEKLLILLRNKLLKHDENHDLCDENGDEIFNNIISRGIYSKAVISKLLKNGISKQQMVRSMKCGLQNLKPAELKHFRTFNITSDHLKLQNLTDNIDKELITKLTSVGFNEQESLDIILTGLLNQNKCRLFRLTLNGIATNRILNWQGPSIHASNQIMQFLEKLGIDENTLQTVREKGVSEEAQDMLNDLGYSDSLEEIFPNEEEKMECTCNLEIQEEINTPCSLSSEKLGETLIQISSSFDVQSLSEPKKRKILERKNYLRQNLMVPLTWAMSRALRYNPTNPVHYIACQLIRWKYNNADPLEMSETLDFVIEATSKKDKILVEEKNKQEEKDLVESNSTPCQHCLEEMELHRVNKSCWKCMKKWVPKYASCQFPELCGSCKPSVPEIAATTSLDRFKTGSKRNANSKEIHDKHKTSSLACSQH